MMKNKGFFKILLSFVLCVIVSLNFTACSLFNSKSNDNNSNNPSESSNDNGSSEPEVEDSLLSYTSGTTQEFLLYTSSEMVSGEFANTSISFMDSSSVVNVKYKKNNTSIQGTVSLVNNSVGNVNIYFTEDKIYFKYLLNGQSMKTVRNASLFYMIENMAELNSGYSHYIQDAGFINEEINFINQFLMTLFYSNVSTFSSYLSQMMVYGGETQIEIQKAVSGSTKAYKIMYDMNNSDESFDNNNEKRSTYAVTYKFVNNKLSSISVIYPDPNATLVYSNVVNNIDVPNDLNTYSSEIAEADDSSLNYHSSSMQELNDFVSMRMQSGSFENTLITASYFDGSSSEIKFIRDNNTIKGSASIIDTDYNMTANVYFTKNETYFNINNNGVTTKTLRFAGIFYLLENMTESDSIIEDNGFTDLEINCINILFIPLMCSDASLFVNYALGADNSDFLKIETATYGATTAYKIDLGFEGVLTYKFVANKLAAISYSEDSFGYFFKKGTDDIEFPSDLNTYDSSAAL